MSETGSRFEGYLPGTPEYRRVVWSLFAAGTATFVLLYSTQAASLHLFTYYLGSAVFGTAAGLAWTHGHWLGVVGLSLVLLAVTAGLTLVLRRTPSLVPGQS